MVDIRYDDGTIRHVYGGPGLNGGTEPAGDDRKFARQFPRIAGMYRVGPTWVRVVARVRNSRQRTAARGH